MTELQKNSKRNLLHTLEYLASEESQLAYKNAVPFVHIPNELICQWDGHFIKNQKWFREIWTENEWNELIKFDVEFNRICDQINFDDFADVPEVLDNHLWKELISISQLTIDKLNSSA